MGVLATKDVLPQVLELGARLLREHEVDVAALVRLGWQVRDWVDEPDMARAALVPNNVFWGRHVGSGDGDCARARSFWTPCCADWTIPPRSARRRFWPRTNGCAT